MEDYLIVTDSCVDLPAEVAEAMNLVILPLSVRAEDNNYFNYLDEREITFKDFYNELRSKKQTQTSQLNPENFIQAFEPILQAGKDILSISFSSALSGTYHSSVLAKEELLEKYPERKIITIDSLAASMGQGLLLTYVSRIKQEGKSIDEVASWVEKNKLNICHLFTVDDLNHLRRGGRLSTISALLGTILRVKPLLHVSKEGKLSVQGKARGRQSAISLMLERMENTIVEPQDQTIYISHGDCLEDALYLKDEVQKRFGVGEILINYIGPVIGSHSGPGTLAIFYWGNDRSKNE